MNKSSRESTDNSIMSSSSSSSIDIRRLDVGKKIGHSKFPVYEAELPGSEGEYVIKFFPYEKKQLNMSYKNEVRFSSLLHPNIVQVRKTEDDFYVKSEGRLAHVSIIMMEKCDLGDLSSKVKIFKLVQGDMIARTYFHQIIRAIDYLH